MPIGQSAYFHCISSGSCFVFHSITIFSHSFTSSSSSSSNTFVKAARYLPISLSPLSDSLFCSSETQSVYSFPQTDFAVHDLDDVGWPRVSDFDFPGLASVALPDA